MSALEIAKKMGRDAILTKMKELEFQTYGLEAENGAMLLARIAKGAQVDVGLNNADIEGVLLLLLRKSPEKVMEGIKIAAYLIGTEKMVLYLPKSEVELVEQLKELAEHNKIQIICDSIDMRESDGHLRWHIVSAFELVELIEDHYKKEAFISTDGETIRRVAENTKVEDIIALEEAKAVWMGYHFYTPEEAKQKTAKDASNGVIKVIQDKDCIVQETLSKLSDFRNLSCGKCVFCREGLIQLEYMQKEISSARGKNNFVDLTEEIGTAMSDSVLCSVGEVASDLTRYNLVHYQEEYEAHIKKDRCPAGVCDSFVHFYIDPATCIGCGDCMDVCPADCIDGKNKYIHMIDEFDCLKCGKCMEVCEEKAVMQTVGKLPKLPNMLTKVGKFRKR